MKKLKLALFSLAFSLLMFTSCTNDNEPVSQDQQQTEESESITTALGELRTQFDANGNVTETDNPAGNIVLDFCFDFVYPLTLSYNNGTTVTVDDLDGLISILLASTDDLYVSGIAFPFDVETFDDNTDSIITETIDDEFEFIELLLSCEFDDDDIDACFEVYDPVCVEITDPSGETFVVTYPNECYAMEDGFTEDDFIEDCEDDYYVGGGFECFELNFPISVVTEDGEVIVINSEEELGNALYDVYIFDFVYPFTVTVYEDDQAVTVTINSEEDLEDILEDCYEEYDDDDDEECEECEDEPIDPVCVQYTTGTGDVVVEIFPNACFALCLGFTEDDFVDCEDDGVPAECDENDITANLVECSWYAFTTLLPQELELEFVFGADGSLVAETENTVVTGSWDITSSATGGVFMFFTLPEPLEAISNVDWTVIECTEETIVLESNGQILALEQSCD